MTPRRRNILCVESSLSRLAVEAVTLHESLQLQVLAIVLCDPLAGVPCARRCGVHDGMFIQRDLQLIWLACVVAVENKCPRDTLRIARLILTDEHFYGKWSLWDGDKLDAFAVSFSSFPTPLQAFAMRKYVTKLIAVHGALMAMDRNHRDSERRLLDIVRPLPVAMPMYVAKRGAA